MIVGNVPERPKVGKEGGINHLEVPKLLIGLGISNP